MSRDVLKSIMDDLNRISNIDKNSLFTSKVKDVIDANYQSYQNMLKVNFDYLLYRDNLKVIKTIKREKVKREKKNEV